MKDNKTIFLRKDLECPYCDDSEVYQIRHQTDYLDVDYKDTFRCANCNSTFVIEKITELYDIKTDETKWIIPYTGWGIYQDLFNDYYDAIEGELLEEHPEWEDDEFCDERISTACELAEKAVFEYLEERNIKILMEGDSF